MLLEHRHLKGNFFFRAAYAGSANADRPTSGISLKCRVEQAACVSGPLQPSL